MDGDQQPTYLSVRETARRLAVHENTVRNWVSQGVLASARVAGSRYHRFDERDVERLRAQRGSIVPTVEPERRAVGPELVDASQINSWAKTRPAQELFPELMRRLLASSPGVTNVSIRAGDGVALAGWDGRAEANGVAFLPNGSLAFEFGVGDGVKAKADSDYEKRRSDPLGIDPRTSCFVFATPRRWPAGPKWEAERRKEGHFAAVRVLDADDLEGWLQATPVVHYWLSERLNRRPQDAETLEHWWSRFADQTDPVLSTALFMAGRAQQAEQLKAVLTGRPAITSVKTGWQEDAKGFVNAIAEELAATGRPIQPPLLVHSSAVWSQVVASSGRTTLIPTFENPDVAAAQSHGHHVLLVASDDYVAGAGSIELPRLGRGQTEEALQSMGIRSDRAYELAPLARRSLPSLVRKISRDRRVARPSWTRPPLVRIFGPLTLIGSWTSAQEDVALVERAVGQSWPEIELHLNDLRNSDDPPFVRPGGQWHLASADEAFILVQERLTSTDLSKWHESAVEVLTERDPAFSLETSERQLAGLRGVRRRFSAALRRGLAEGAAMLGSASSQLLSDGVSGPERADRLIRAVLDWARQDDSGQSWQSLSDVLPLLAEAAPQSFLDAVSDDLDRPTPLLKSMFQDRDDTSWMFSSSPHTGLLWALETLCWSPEFLGQATRSLAGLQTIDPGGRLSNRPLASLSEVLVGWIRHTAAPLQVKLSAIEQVCRNYPEVGWELVRRLWPSHHGISSPPARTHFRDWRPDSDAVSMAEWFTYVGHLVGLAVRLAGEDTGRWGELAGRIAPLPDGDRGRVLEGLEQVAKRKYSPDQQLVLWERVNAEVLKHRRFASADWALDASSLSRLSEIARLLEPTTDAQRYAYLFNWHPDLPDVEPRDHDTYRRRLAKLRVAAIEDTIRSESIEGLARLAQKAPVPSQLGFTLGGIDSDDLTPNLLSWLDADEDKLREVAESWARHRLFIGGAGWLRTSMARPELQRDGRRTVLARNIPANKEAWDALDEIDEALSNSYWSTVAHIVVEPNDLDRAVRELLKRSRAWVAVELLSLSMHGGLVLDGGTPELVQSVLDAALRSDPTQSSGGDGYSLGQLLDYLNKSGHATDALMKYEFVFFRLLEHSREPKALYAGLARDHEMFVELVKRVYRGKNESQRTQNEGDEVFAKLSWWVLRGWKGYPGRLSDGTMDAGTMRKWVSDARLALADADRADVGDEVIGEALAWSPPGEDGLWPAEPVRDLVESIGSTQLAAGLHIGVINRRGVTTRSPYDGGEQERKEAAKYAAWAREAASRWPRTSRILRGLAESYERDAQREDARAEVVADTQ